VAQALLPYRGRQEKYRFESPGKGATRRVDFDGDVKTYVFNSLGYRGEEFDPDAAVKLFVCGCSYTFGAGLDLEETWSYHFRQKVADHHGLPASSVNLMNFGEGGASNDYIARTLTEQCLRVRPDLVVVGFTFMNRFELFDGAHAVNFGSWAISEQRHGEMARLGEFLFLGTDEIQEKVRMIKNVLLLQYFFRSLNIPFVYFFFEALRRPELPEALSTPATKQLYEEIDLELLVPIGPDNMLDRSADRGHPGPRSQELLAETAWQTFRARYA
jgi:hypothetical protein